MSRFACLGPRLLTACGVIVACSTACATSSTTTQTRTDGRLKVQPLEFTYDVGCSFASGDSTELGYYVASLIDLGPTGDEGESTEVDAGSFPRAVESSTSARCTSSLAFSTSATEGALVEVGHRYVSIIDGYVGSNPPELMGERSSAQWPLPQWQWLCGVGGLDTEHLRWLLDRVGRLRVAPPAVTDGGAPPTEADSAVTSALSAPPLDAGSIAPPPPALSDAAPAEDGSVTTVGSADASPATESDAGATPAATAWSQLEQAASTEGFPEPALVVAGGQSGLRGCVQLF